MLQNKFTFTYQTNINTTAEELYKFHTDTRNLPKITPPWIQVNIVNLSLPLEEKSEILLDIKQHGLTLRWQMSVDKLLYPLSVCDKAIKSPFKTFYHERMFEEVDDHNTLFKDVITLSLPLYPLSLIALPLIKRDMNRMFDYRHQQTKRLLETN